MSINMGIVFGRPIEIDENGRVKTKPVKVERSDTPPKEPPDELKPKRRVLPKSNHIFEPRLFGRTKKALPEVDTTKPKAPVPKAKKEPKPKALKKPKEQMVPKGHVVQETERVHTREPWPTIRVGTALPRDFRIRITTERKRVLREWAEDEMDEHGYTREQFAAVLGMTVGTLRNICFNQNRTVMSSISLYDYLRAYYRGYTHIDRIIEPIMQRYTKAMMQDRQAEWHKLEDALDAESVKQELEKPNGTQTKTPED